MWNELKMDNGAVISILFSEKSIATWQWFFVENFPFSLAHVAFNMALNQAAAASFIGWSVLKLSRVPGEPF